MKQSPIYHSSVDSANDEANHKQHDSTKRTDVGDVEASLDDLSNIQITPTTFMNMCPALLVQIEQRACKDDELGVRSNNAADDEHEDDNHGGHSHRHSEPKQSKQKEISAYGNLIDKYAHQISI